jgi:hypothetical protein
MVKVINKNGAEIDFDAAFEIMDNKIAYSIDAETEQEFFTVYEKKHEEKYGEEWELSKANPVY